MPRVEVLTDAVERLARIAVAREAREARVDRVTGADLDLTVAHPCVEVVERAHRRPAGHLTLEAVDPAVARADEALRRGRPAHRAAQVHAARGDRDDRRVGRRRRGDALALVELRVAAADVDGRLADGADALRGRDDARDVVVVREVVRLADRRPDHGARS